VTNSSSSSLEDGSKTINHDFRFLVSSRHRQIQIDFVLFAQEYFKRFAAKSHLKSSLFDTRINHQM
jgi:hypothetical protein